MRSQEEKFSQGFTRDRAATGGREKQVTGAPFLFPETGHQLVHGLEGRGGSGGSWRVVCPTTLVMLGTGVTSRTLVLLLTPQKQPSRGLVFFGILLPIICPSCAACGYFQFFIISLYSVYKEMFAQVQTLQQGSQAWPTSHFSPSTRSYDHKRPQACCS